MTNVIKVSDQEFHTIIAALRYYQVQRQAEPSIRSTDIDNIATNMGELEALNPEGIDELCERINFEASPVGANPWGDYPEYPVEDWQYDVSDGLTRLGYGEWVDEKRESTEEE